MIYYRRRGAYVGYVHNTIAWKGCREHRRKSREQEVPKLFLRQVSRRLQVVALRVRPRTRALLLAAARYLAHGRVTAWRRLGAGWGSFGRPRLGGRGWAGPHLPTAS